MNAEQKLSAMGIELPEASAPKAMYIPVKQVGNLLFVSGQIPLRNGQLAYTGKLGKDLSLAEGEEAARICIINMLSALKGYLNDLDKIKNVVKLQAFVSCVPGFDKQHILINAASQMLYDVFGECGRHTRTAIGTNQLPLDAPVEIEAIFEI